MTLVFDSYALEDLQYWVKVDRKKAQRILTMVQSLEKDPVHGLGKPEPLKHQLLSGCWSRRIDHQHRLVYGVDHGQIRILSCRYHY